jgi:hypothetical protein
MTQIDTPNARVAQLVVSYRFSSNLANANFEERGKFHIIFGHFSTNSQKVRLLEKSILRLRVRASPRAIDFL